MSKKSMPWFWSDEAAAVLLAQGTIDEARAKEMSELPIAFRSEHDSIEQAAAELAEEGEIPLAA